jgi:hypothetical protein
VSTVALAVDSYRVDQVRDPRVLASRLTADFTSVVSTSDAARVTALEATITNIPAASITAGNVAQARLTNALATAGSTIGGNIPIAAVTNLLFGTAQTTQTIYGVDSSTNVFIWSTVGGRKVLDSLTITP